MVLLLLLVRRARHNHRAPPGIHRISRSRGPGYYCRYAKPDTVASPATLLEREENRLESMKKESNDVLIITLGNRFVERYP
jgi:hypothetical protein